MALLIRLFTELGAEIHRDAVQSDALLVEPEALLFAPVIFELSQILDQRIFVEALGAVVRIHEVLELTDLLVKHLEKGLRFFDLALFLL